MPRFEPAAKISDIPPGAGKPITLGGKTIALFNLNGQYYAIDDMCPHRGGSLGRGELRGRLVICPMHQWTFDVTTGRMPMGGGVQSYRVCVEGEWVLVEV